MIGAGVSAQTNTGEIGGVVLDASGGVLPGTRVVATHPASGVAIERLTDAEGRFFLPALPTGVWEVVAELSGFRRTTQTGITLELRTSPAAGVHAVARAHQRGGVG